MSSFTMTTLQIWSCHVTLTANLENFYFWSNSILNFRKVTKFEGNWLKNEKLKARNKTRGGKHPPLGVLIGLKPFLSYSVQEDVIYKKNYLFTLSLSVRVSSHNPLFGSNNFSSIVISCIKQSNPPSLNKILITGISSLFWTQCWMSLSGGWTLLSEFILL